MERNPHEPRPRRFGSLERHRCVDVEVGDPGGEWTAFRESRMGRDGEQRRGDEEGDGQPLEHGTAKGPFAWRDHGLGWRYAAGRFRCRWANRSAHAAASTI